MRIFVKADGIGRYRDAAEEEIEEFERILSNSEERMDERPVSIEDQMASLKAENADLRAQLSETQDALMELAEIITEM